MNNEPVLHVWPSGWGLPSTEPASLAAIMYLQQLIPGKFSLAECSNPDLSPTGQIPYLVHEQHVVSCLLPILNYVAGLKATEPFRSTSNIEVPLNSKKRSQTTAWCAHVEAHLGDLVAYALYSNFTNWSNLTHPTLASLYSFPQRYYVPVRIRDLYQPRLEAAGLWVLPMKDEDKQSLHFKVSKQWTSSQNTKLFQDSFTRERVLERARSNLGLYARLVRESEFIYRDSPTTLDSILAAHILLLVEPEYPDPFLRNLIKDTFPELALHAHRVLNHVCDQSLRISPPPKFLWSSLIPQLSVIQKQQLSEKSAHFRRMRWGFYGITAGTLAVYLVVSYHSLQTRLSRFQ